MEENIDISTALIKDVKNTFDAYFSGNIEVWFEHLSKDSIYLGSGEPALVGKKAIINHFNKYKGMNARIVDEDYHVIMQGKTLGIVYGQLVTGMSSSAGNTVTRFTIIYRIRKSNFEVILQHNSYEHQYNNIPNKNAPIMMDAITLQFVRDLIVHQEDNEKIAIQSGTQTYWCDTNMILYIQSIGKKTEFVCADRILTCNKSISELKAILPNIFYPIHRSYLVNVNHIVKIRRFEAEMINSAIIPIPALNYTKVKKELLTFLNKQGPN